MSHICPFKFSPQTKDRECSEHDCQLWVSSSHNGGSQPPKEMCSFQGIFQTFTAALIVMKEIKDALPGGGPPGGQ